MPRLAVLQCPKRFNTHERWFKNLYGINKAAAAPCTTAATDSRVGWAAAEAEVNCETTQRFRIFNFHVIATSSDAIVCGLGLSLAMSSRNAAIRRVQRCLKAQAGLVTALTCIQRCKAFITTYLYRLRKLQFSSTTASLPLVFASARNASLACCV